jgi:hypothetical protein
MGHPPRIPVWLGWEQSEIYFVTICVKNRKRGTGKRGGFQCIKERCCETSRMACPCGDSDARSSPCGRRTTRARGSNWEFLRCAEAMDGKELNASWEWQPGFDRLLRSNESLHEKWLCLQKNPVRAGLVKEWKDWPYRFEFNEEQ